MIISYRRTNSIGVRLLFVLLILVSSVITVSAQRAFSGKVRDAVTHKPIAVANVFLSNTSVGAVTDDNGAFTIPRFPSGRYDLVISCMGYETYILQVTSDHIPQDIVIDLKPKVNELKEVIVETYDKNGWAKYGTFFLENFIGESAFAKNCVLRNKDALHFRFSKKTNTLRVSADETLVIENNSLGYVLRYTLTAFSYEYKTRICFYQGYPLFTEMQAKRERQQKRWESNREYAYDGSMMHFLRSLYRNEILENHFEVRRIFSLPNEERQRVKTIYDNQVKKLLGDSKNIMLESNMGFENTDSANYYNKVLHRPEELRVLVDRLLPGDSIAYGIDSVTVGLDFKDHLQVIYPLKKAPIEYAQRYLYRGAEYAPVSSEISILNGLPIAVLANGSYFEGVNLLTTGYWGWEEKIGNMLPFDYWPPKKKTAK